MQTTVCLKFPPESGKNWVGCSSGPGALRDTVMRPTGPDVETARRKRAGEGVKYQGLADRHRYQARPRSDGQGSPRDRVGTEPSPSLGPRRGGAPSGMARAHGPATAAVVRGKQKPRPRNQQSPAHGGKRQEQPSSPRRSWREADDRTTEACAPLCSRGPVVPWVHGESRDQKLGAAGAIGVRFARRVGRVGQRQLRCGSSRCLPTLLCTSARTVTATTWMRRNRPSSTSKFGLGDLPATSSAVRRRPRIDPPGMWTLELAPPTSFDADRRQA